MNSVVCTLFEGHYHHGVAALTNSLYRQGFRGSVYAGYRGGDLPYWTRTCNEINCSVRDSCRTFNVAEGLELHFLLIDTEYHLTNYKPDFMLRLWETVVPDATALYYFDPDIVLIGPWAFFDKWVTYGVALCEDVNSPLAEYHPRRMAWRNYFGKNGIDLTYKNSIYANGGFVGLSKESESFLQTWRNVQEVMAPAIGGLNRSSLAGEPLSKEAQGPFSPFAKTDQDALNAAVEAWDGKISFIGKEGMAFKAGESLMPHALGTPKPWNTSPIREIFAGKPPLKAQREYWNNANGVIVSKPARKVKWQKLCISTAAFLGRFYKKGAV